MSERYKWQHFNYKCSPLPFLHPPSKPPSLPLSQSHSSLFYARLVGVTRIVSMATSCVFVVRAHSRFLNTRMRTVHLRPRWHFICANRCRHYSDGGGACFLNASDSGSFSAIALPVQSDSGRLKALPLSTPRFLAHSTLPRINTLSTIANA